MPNLIINFYEVLNDFEESSRKARTKGKVNEDGSVKTINQRFPSLEEIKAEVAQIFSDGDINQKVVNSDNDMSSLLDRESGQLRLDSAVNIFIGGSILDRGITINNMLCFFYGRDPKKFQQDTVLQHARFYGYRDLEDMAVTRLHTSHNIHRALVRMHHLDEDLRNWFLQGYDKADPHITFIGYDKDVQPCAPSKIRPSRGITICDQDIFLPVGMKTGSATAIAKTVKEIDELITSAPGYADKDEDGFFQMDAARAMEILRKIESTYRYDDENRSEEKDMLELMAAFHYCSIKSGGKVWALHRTNRNANRIRENGNWTDAPADGRTDLAPARAKAITEPVLMLFRENGEVNKVEKGLKPDGTPEYKNIGWSGTPFYWPELLTQSELTPVLFAVDQKASSDVVILDYTTLLEGLDRNEVLNLPFKGDPTEVFGEEGTEYENDEECPVETRSVRQTTWHRYLKSDLNGKVVTAPEVEVDENHWVGVYTYNGGKFPFMLEPYKYILLRAGSTAMLLELQPFETWPTPYAHQEIDEDGCLTDFIESDKQLINVQDTLIAKNRDEKEFTDDEICQWVVEYPIKKVLKVCRLQLSGGEESDAEEED